VDEVQKEREALREEVKEQQEKGGKRGMLDDLAKNPSQSWGTSRVEIRGD
jgi:hypothetical protein